VTRAPSRSWAGTDRSTGCAFRVRTRVLRRHREGTLILETDFETDTGAAKVIDFMPPRNGGAPQPVRIVEGLHGEVAMHMQFVVRFDYGSLVPWVERTVDGILALGGPNALHLSTTAETHGEDLTTVADFTVPKGARERFSLMWFPSHGESPAVEGPDSGLARTEAYWRDWSFPQAFRHLTLVEAAKTLANPTADVAVRYVDRQPVRQGQR
jgi:GH15 family glucan-1,4-alpha-glucosidase